MNTVESKQCPICGEDIVFCYKTPTKTFKINVDQEIVRDDAWEGPEYDNPYLKFYCSGDMEHDVDTEEIERWTDRVESIFRFFILPDL